MCKNYFKTALVVSFLVFFTNLNLKAEGLNSTSDYSSLIVMNGMLNSYNPAATAMGGITLSKRHSAAWASFYNPAISAFSETRFNLASAYTNIGPSSEDNNNNITVAASGLIKKKFGIALGTSYSAMAKYDIIDESNNILGQYRPFDLQVNAGFSYKICKVLSTGINLKYFHQQLAKENKYGAFATDIAVMSVIPLGRHNSFNILGGVFNLGPKVNGYKLPSSAQVAGSFEAGVKHQWEIALKMDYFFVDAANISGGFSYGLKDLFWVKMGCCYAVNNMVNSSYASIGGGVDLFRCLGFDTQSLALNFCYLVPITHDGFHLRNTFNIGISVGLF